MEKLHKARHKGQESTHVFIIACLIQPKWKHIIFKEEDFIIQLTAGHPNWLLNIYEYLTINFLILFTQTKTMGYARVPNPSGNKKNAVKHVDRYYRHQGKYFATIMVTLD